MGSKGQLRVCDGRLSVANPVWLLRKCTFGGAGGELSLALVWARSQLTASTTHCYFVLLCYDVLLLLSGRVKVVLSCALVCGMVPFGQKHPMHNVHLCRQLTNLNTSMITHAYL